MPQPQAQRQVSARLSRVLPLVLVALVLSVLVMSLPVMAQPGSTTGSTTGTAATDAGTDPCTGLPPGATWVCDGVMHIIEWFVSRIKTIVQGIFQGVVQFIVDTPAPYHDGTMAFFKHPDNAPWGSLYDLYLTKTLPIGIAMWALIVLLLQLTRLFTYTAAGEYRRARLMRRAAFGLLMLIAWWPIGAFVLHMGSALTTAIAPSGEQMAGTVNEFFGNIGGGLIAAILLYFSSGVIAFLLLIVFLTRHVAIYVLMPLMPVLIPLWIIDEGPMKYLAGIAESIGGLFVPFVFMTLPTAAILLVGYTIQDALRQSLGPIAVLPGGQEAATSAYAIILFVFWVMALIAPLFVLFGRRAGLPLAYLTAGYLGARGLRGAARRGSSRIWHNGPSIKSPFGNGETAAGSRSLPAVHTDQPIALETHSRTGNGNGAGDGTVGSGGVVGPLTRVRDTDGIGGDGGADPGIGGTESWSATRHSPWDDVSGGIDQGSVRARVTPESGFDQQLPDDRRYTFGYSRDGGFQQVGRQERLTKSDVMEQKYPEFADSRLYEGKSDMYLRDDQGQLYDVTPRWQYDQQHTRFDAEAREVVLQARDYGSGTAAEHKTSNGGTGS